MYISIVHFLVGNYDCIQSNMMLTTAVVLYAPLGHFTFLESIDISKVNFKPSNIPWGGKSAFYSIQKERHYKGGRVHFSTCELVHSKGSKHTLPHYFNLFMI